MEGGAIVEKKVHGGFFLCLLWNGLLYFLWTVPAWILLVLHFTIGLPIIWFWAAFGAWGAAILFRTLLILFARYGSAHRISSPENKNPYSQKTRDPYAQMRGE